MGDSVTLEEREATRRRQVRYQKKVHKTPSPAVQRRMDDLCSRLAADHSLTLGQACAEVGIRRNTEEQYRTRYPAYHNRILFLMAKRRGEVANPDRDYDADYVEEYLGFTTPEHLGRIRQAILDAEAAAKRDQQPKAVLILAPPDHAKSTEVENYL